MKPILLLLLFIITSCASIPQAPVVVAPPVEPIEVIDPIIVNEPVEVKKPFVFVKKCTNCNASQNKFIMDSVFKVNETIAGECFAEFMTQRKLIDTNSLSPAEVVKKLVGADINIDTEMYYTTKKVLGYTLTGQKIDQYKIWINSRYMQEWGLCDLASLIGHETSHKAGFSHSYYSNSSRPFSVPYSINAAFTKCCAR